MLKKYMLPPEMPEIFLDDGGVVNILFGNITLTVEHIVHSIPIQQKLTSGKKAPTMIVAENAFEVSDDLSVVGRSEEISAITSALAVVTHSKIGMVLGNIFMSLQKNPYPTKLYNNEDSARKWLKQCL